MSPSIEIDTIGPLVNQLCYYCIRAVAQPGRQHQVDANYFRRIEAVELPSKMTMDSIRAILPRRMWYSWHLPTSKTPLSTYLAQRGLKVANVPLVMGIEPPAELFRVDQSKIFGLSIRAEHSFEFAKRVYRFWVCRLIQRMGCEST